jgi:hypothetical protein
MVTIVLAGVSALACTAVAASTAGGRVWPQRSYEMRYLLRFHIRMDVDKTIDHTVGQCPFEDVYKGSGQEWWSVTGRDDFSWEPQVSRYSVGVKTGYRLRGRRFSGAWVREATPYVWTRSTSKAPSCGEATRTVRNVGVADCGTRLFKNR